MKSPKSMPDVSTGQAALKGYFIERDESRRAEHLRIARELYREILDAAPTSTDCAHECQRLVHEPETIALLQLPVVQFVEAVPRELRLGVLDRLTWHAPDLMVLLRSPACDQALARWAVTRIASLDPTELDYASLSHELPELQEPARGLMATQIGQLLARDLGALATIATVPALDMWVAAATEAVEQANTWLQVEAAAADLNAARLAVRAEATRLAARVNETEGQILLDEYQVLASWPIAALDVWQRHVDHLGRRADAWLVASGETSSRASAVSDARGHARTDAIAWSADACAPHLAGGGGRTCRRCGTTPNAKDQCCRNCGERTDDLASNSQQMNASAPSAQAALTRLDDEAVALNAPRSERLVPPANGVGRTVFLPALIRDRQLRVQPTDDAPATHGTLIGRRAVVLEIADPWVRVRHSGGAVGWIKRSLLTVREPPLPA